MFAEFKQYGNYISIHALLAESDYSLVTIIPSNFSFLSTLSLRRATVFHCFTIINVKDFYPRSPCGERRLVGVGGINNHVISIHALLAESDLKTPCVKLSIDVFLSTLSLRRATAKVHKTVGHFCAYETNFMGIASSC